VRFGRGRFGSGGELKSMHMQINKQKCILKLSLFNLFDMHLMNILKQTLAYL
jgi:hypothetical protein